MVKTIDIPDEHYGDYGPVCINTGQFDAGECYFCEARRKMVEREVRTAAEDRARKKYEKLVKPKHVFDN